jgi:hypothetical protein
MFTSRTDMGGQYAIPAHGSGSGFGYGNATFNGEVWDIYAEAEDDLPIWTDYTAQDKWWLTHVLDGLKKMAEAMGKPIGPLGRHIEQGAASVPGAAVPSHEGAHATSLSGSLSETLPTPDALGVNLPNVPMTSTVSWNLKKAPARSHVKIYGPPCGCIDPETGDKTLHFIAGASPVGGELSEFIVSSSGQPPEIVSNVGGERPTLDIRGTKDTGAVTLKIRYTRNGVTSLSAPLTVDFCHIEKIELADGDEHDLAFDLDGKLVVDAKTRAWRGGREVSGELEWDLEKMGAPTSLQSEPSTKKGAHVKFTYENMPRANSDFGEKKLTAKTTGTCDCKREETIRALYPDVDSNHPDDGTPNWFYYWRQTSALPGSARSLTIYQDVVVDPDLPGHPIARYDQKSQRILISRDVFGTRACRDEVDPENHFPTGRHAQGIDCFGETVRHELQHRADAVAWWGGPAGPYAVSLLDWFLGDWDHDQVPNKVEDSLAQCKAGAWTNAPIDAAKLLTLQDDLVARGKQTWFTCRKRPFADVTDAEINAYWQGWMWPIGSVDSEDWSCGDLSKPWTGKKCGR